MASLQSTPSRKLRYEQHILETQNSRTSPRSSNPSSAATSTPLGHSDSSGSNLSSSSDPPKSFLALSAESSPTTTHAVNSSPYSVTQSPMTTRAADSNKLVNAMKNRFEGESSFFPYANPVVSHSLGAGSNHIKGSNDFPEAESSRQALEPTIKAPSAISRGSRLGALMGRTRSEQTSTLSRDDSTLSPPGLQSISSSSISPIRKDINHVEQGKTGSLGARMNRELRSHSPSLQASYRDTNAFLDSPESRRNGDAGIKFSSLHGPAVASSHTSHRVENDLIARNQVSSPTSQSALSRRIEAEKKRQTEDTSEFYGTMPVSSVSALPFLHDSNLRGQGGEHSQPSLQGDVYSPTTSSSSVTSPNRSYRGGHLAASVPGGGRLGRLQYSKADPVHHQSGPGWDMSATSNRGASLTTRPNLMGRVSNPNMLSDFKKGEHSSEIQWAGMNRNDSIPGTVQDDVHGQQDQGTIRPVDRRELMLPALNGMRTAVESVLSKETILKKGERRRSSIAYQQSMPSSEDRFNSGQSSQPMSPREAALAEVWHRRTPSLETSTTSPAITDEIWQRVGDVDQQKDSSRRPNYPLSSSPTQKSVATVKSAASIEKDTSANVGQLSDEAIVRLGAVPGIKPSSLLNPNGQPLSSKNILTIALQKAQSAVLLDSANNVPDAIMAYRQAVRLLQEVMERVSPNNTSGSRRKSSRDEERRRLKVIHDTYAERIRLLGMINSPNEELDDSSMGEDSFNRQSPTPVRTMKSKDDLMLNGLGINDDKTENQAPPQIAIAISDIDPSTDSNITAVRILTSNKMDRHASLHGSDSDASFRSARDPVSRPSTEGISALVPALDRHRLQPLRNSAGDEIISVPVTPYFDSEPDSIGTETSLASHTKVETERDSKTPVDPPLSAFATAPIRSVSPEEKRPRDSQDRTVRGNSSLHNVPSAVEIAASDRQSSRRFLSIGSQAQFQREVSPSSPLRGRVEDVQDFAEDKAALGKDVVFGNRPRALTLGINGQGRMLVSSTVTSGMISQRRKMAGTGLGSGSGLKASDDDVFRSDGRASPQVSVDRAAARNGSAGDISIAGKVTPSSEDDPDTSVDVKFSAGRKRAISQPSNRRPSIPASFMNMIQPNSGSAQGPPPVPKIKRKASMPLTPLIFQQQQQGTLRAANNGASSFRFPSPAPSATSGYHALGTPLTVMSQYPWCNPVAGANNGETANAMMLDLFPSSLPSLQMGAVPSYTSNSYPVHLPWIGVTSSLPDFASFALPPLQKSMRPFYIMKLLQASIERGSYITKRLYLSRDLWLQSGSRLLAIDTKVRMLDSISNGIDGIEHAGGQFLLHPSNRDHPGLNAINASKFLKLLEDFETLLVEVQNTLAKKLGFLETVDGKKSGNSFGSFGSKLTRSLDRMTNNAKSNTDTPANYVDGISRLFIKAQIIGEHLRTLDRSKRELESPTRDSELDNFIVEIYATLPAELKQSIEFKLKRASEFFTNVILRFVLRDIAILVDKSVKRNTLLLTE